MNAKLHLNEKFVMILVVKDVLRSMSLLVHMFWYIRMKLLTLW